MRNDPGAATFRGAAAAIATAGIRVFPVPLSAHA